MAKAPQIKRAKGVERDIVYNRADLLVCKKKFNLNEDVQIEVRKNYKNYDSTLQLTKDVFQDQLLDEHSPEFKSIKEFVARLYKGVEMHNFTEDQINFIADNGEGMRPIEIARIIFPDVEGHLLHECKYICNLLEALGIQHEDKKIHGGPLGNYKPPPTVHKALALINRADPQANYFISGLDSEKRRCIDAVIRNLGSSRFIAMCSAIRRETLRDVFEIELVKSTYDKPDLTPEEVNSYINLAHEYVLSISLTEEMAMLKDAMEESLGHEDGPRLSKSIADATSAKIREYDDCQKRMMKLHEDLAGKRSDRLKLSGAIKESLAKWIELAKLEEGRAYMVRLAKIRNEKLEKEAHRIEDLAELVAEIRGVNISEIINF